MGCVYTQGIGLHDYRLSRLTSLKSTNPISQFKSKGQKTSVESPRASFQSKAVTQEIHFLLGGRVNHLFYLGLQVIG